MPVRQTALERIQYALTLNGKTVTYLIPHFPDEGEDNGYFANEPAELLEVSRADLLELLALIGRT